MKKILAAFALFALAGCASTDSASYHYTQKQIDKGDLDFEGRLRVDEYVNAFPQGDLAKPKPGEDIAVKIDFFTDTMAKTGNTTLAQIAVRTREASVAEKSRRLALAVVLDVSGSMTDDNKFNDAIDALLAMLLELPQGTEFSLIRFSDDAKIWVHPTTVSQTTREGLREAVRNLSAGGGTNIEDGLVLGYKTMATFPKGVNSRLLLLTDGQSNVGVTDPEAIAARAGVQYDAGYRISTIGLGHGVDEHLLRTIAEKGKGAYYFAENSAALKGLFMKDIRSLMIPIVKGASVSIKTGAGTVLRKVYGHEEGVVNGGFSGEIGEMNSDDWRIYVAEVEGMPSRTTAISLEAAVTHVGKKGTSITKKSSAAIRPSGTKPVVNKAVARNAAIFSNALSLIQVSRLVREAEYKKADEILTVQMANLEVVRKWDSTPELAKEADSLAKVRSVVRSRVPRDAQPALPAERSFLKEAVGVGAQVMPGPWSLVFGLLQLALD